MNTLGNNSLLFKKKEKDKQPNQRNSKTHRQIADRQDKTEQQDKQIRVGPQSQLEVRDKEQRKEVSSKEIGLSKCLQAKARLA